MFLFKKTTGCVLFKKTTRTTKDNYNNSLRRNRVYGVQKQQWVFILKDNLDIATPHSDLGQRTWDNINISLRRNRVYGVQEKTTDLL